MGKKQKHGPIYRSPREMELIALARQMRKEFDRIGQHAAAAKALVACEVWLQTAVFAVNGVTATTVAARENDVMTDQLMTMLDSIHEIQRRMGRIAQQELGFSLYGDATAAPDPAALVGAIEDFLAAGGDFS